MLLFRQIGRCSRWTSERSRGWSGEAGAETAGGADAEEVDQIVPDSYRGMGPSSRSCTGTRACGDGGATSAGEGRRFRRRRDLVRDGKGTKDRRTMLPTSWSRGCGSTWRRSGVCMMRIFGRDGAGLCAGRAVAEAAERGGGVGVAGTCFVGEMVRGFPGAGRTPGSHHTHDRGIGGRYEAVRAAGLSSGRRLPHLPSFVRDASSCRPATISGRCRSCWATGRPDDDDLHPRSESRRAGRAEPGGPSIGWLTRQPMSYKNDSTEPSVPPRSCFSALYGRSRASLR